MTDDLPEGARVLLIAAFEIVGSIRAGDDREALELMADDFYSLVREHVELGD